MKDLIKTIEWLKGFDQLLGSGEHNNHDGIRSAIYHLENINTQIKQACDKQKKICAETYLRYYPIIEIPNSLASEIKTSPYPEGVE